MTVVKRFSILHHPILLDHLCNVTVPGSGVNREVYALLCVQRRLACSAGDSPAGVEVRSPVAWIAGWRETKTLKPIDWCPRGGCASHRAVMKMNVEVASKVKRPEGRACNREG